MLDIAVAGKLKVMFRSGLATSGDPELVGPLMSDPYVIAGVSDGGAHTKFFAGGSYTTDYLTWLVRDEKKISLEEAHYHLSYLPAQAAGFADRGFLREGAPADIVVYDLAQLKRTPEWEFEVLHDLPAGEWRRGAAGRGLSLDHRQRRDHLRGRPVHRRDPRPAAAQPPRRRRHLRGGGRVAGAPALRRQRHLRAEREARRPGV